jgi:hypothetical protein
LAISICDPASQSASISAAAPERIPSASSAASMSSVNSRRQNRAYADTTSLQNQFATDDM